MFAIPGLLVGAERRWDQHSTCPRGAPSLLWGTQSINRQVKMNTCWTRKSTEVGRNSRCLHGISDQADRVGGKQRKEGVCGRRCRMSKFSQKQKCGGVWEVAGDEQDRKSGAESKGPELCP